MNLTGLQKVFLSNTNITADIFKVLKKLVSRNIKDVSLWYLPSSDQMIKETLDLMKRDQPNFKIFFMMNSLKDGAVFFNLLAKVHLS